MREPLSCSVELRQFGVWRCGVGAITLCAVAVVAAWSLTGRDSTPSWAVFAAATGTVLLAGWATSLLRREPGTLATFGGSWRFTSFRDASTPEEGRLTIAIDLGTFMLLVLPSRDASGRTTCRWLPAQRRGLEGHWHALRCAAYAPQRPSERP